jgi:hypothetical protein
MELTDRTPLRLTQVSLLFSLANFIISGVSGSSIGLFLIFTLSIYSTTKIYVSINQIQHSTHADMSSLIMNMVIAGIIFIGIASFTYSHLFGIFYVTIAVVYLVSPYDRSWLAGKTRIVVYNNKVEYQEV